MHIMISSNEGNTDNQIDNKHSERERHYALHADKGTVDHTEERKEGREEGRKRGTRGIGWPRKGMGEGKEEREERGKRERKY